jgi:hypothetical protein
MGPMVVGRGLKSVEETIYEGNRLGNIDPYMWLPDPNVPAHRAHEGAFAGWIERTDRLTLEGDEKGQGMFNVKYLRGMTATSTLYKGTSSATGGREIIGRDSSSLIDPVDVVTMYVRLIPDEWGLGKGTKPETWRFMLAGESILIDASPLGLNHQQFPITVCCPDLDGYDVFPMSKIETIYGLQTLMNWMVNSHVKSRRQIGRGKYIIDPMSINVGSVFDDDSPVILTKEILWGKGNLDGVIKQLEVQDVTRGNIADTSFIAEFTERTVGVNDPVQGILKGGSERRTATEISSVMQQAMGRMGKTATLIAATSHYDLAFQLACNTQQFLSDDTYARVTGRLEDHLRRVYGYQGDWAKVRPQDIAVGFDCIPKDVADPSKVNAETWARLLETAARIPAIQGRYDLGGLFGAMADKLGVDNLDRFEVKVMPDEQVGNMAASGQILPVAMGNQTMPDGMGQMGQ